MLTTLKLPLDNPSSYVVNCFMLLLDHSLSPGAIWLFLKVIFLIRPFKHTGLGSYSKPSESDHRPARLNPTHLLAVNSARAVQVPSNISGSRARHLEIETAKRLNRRGNRRQLPAIGQKTRQASCSSLNSPGGISSVLAPTPEPKTTSNTWNVCYIVVIMKSVKKLVIVGANVPFPRYSFNQNHDWCQEVRMDIEQLDHSSNSVSIPILITLTA